MINLIDSFLYWTVLPNVILFKEFKKINVDYGNSSLWVVESFVFIARSEREYSRETNVEGWRGGRIFTSK